MFCFVFFYSYQKKLKAENPEEHERLYGRGPRKFGEGERPCPAGKQRGVAEAVPSEQVVQAVELSTTEEPENIEAAKV